jgi:AraC-like DNA-binding protein
MDKTCMKDDRILRDGMVVHKMPRGIQRVHKTYGLWIHTFGTITPPPNNLHSTPKRYFEFFSISHLLEGRGRLLMPPNREVEIKPGQCVIMPPRQINRYGGVEGEAYIEDNICFSGPVADMLFRTGVITPGVFEMGPARRLLPIQELASDPSEHSQINANIALQKLLVDLFNENRNSSSKRQRHMTSIDTLLETLKERLDKWWTLDEMADFCGIGTDQFRRLFKKRTGLLPKTYMDKLKMTKASEMLISTDKTIEEIARRLSYMDPYHFSRRFRQLVGISPSRYRQQYGFNSVMRK